MKILFLLKEQELCVCELESVLKLSQPAISQHLRILREANLVTEQRAGQWVFYSLNREEIIEQLEEFLKGIELHSNLPPSLNMEAKRLKDLQKHPLVEHPLALSRIKEDKEQAK